MCFSATSSFIVSAATATAGVMALSQVKSPRQVPLAAMPLLFALQQSLEGALWLILPLGRYAALADTASLLFLLVALVLWPVYVPVAVLMIEPDAFRRKLLRVCLAVGLAVGALLFWTLVEGGHAVRIESAHIVYGLDYRYFNAASLGYVVASVIPMLLSSRSAVRLLGLIVSVGYAVTYYAYLQAFLSVWCFFAAAGSVVLLAHFRSPVTKSEPSTASRG